MEKGFCEPEGLQKPFFSLLCFSCIYQQLQKVEKKNPDEMGKMLISSGFCLFFHPMLIRKPCCKVLRCLRLKSDVGYRLYTHR
jgi:hypothetical protein